MDMQGWLPARIRLNPSWVEWIWAGSRPLSEPFFRQTIQDLRNNGAQQMRTGLDELLAAGATRPAQEPAGLIFHVSRCGSTLVSNSLKLARGVVVVSEPAHLVQLLPPYQNIQSDDDQITAARILRSLVLIFGYYRTGRKEHVVIKLSSLNMLSLSMIRAIWPNTPFLILIRDPIEVIVSQIRNHAGWLGSRVSSLAMQTLGACYACNPTMGHEEYCARTLGLLCTSAAQMRDRNSFILDYSNISTDTVYDVSRLFGLSLPSDRRLDLEIFKWHAKNPALRFEPDTVSKAALATDCVKAAALQWSMPAYLHLRTDSSTQHWRHY